MVRHLGDSADKVGRAIVGKCRTRHHCGLKVKNRGIYLEKVDLFAPVTITIGEGAANMTLSSSEKNASYDSTRNLT